MVNFVHPFMGLLSLLVFIIGIQLIRGKWIFLIAGYNTMTKEEKKHYNDVTVGKPVGAYFLFISFVCLFSKILPLSYQLTIISLLTIFLLLFTIISDKR